MLKFLLLLISILLILISYLNIILTIIKTKNIKLKDITGFDLIKSLTTNYDEINIVESKEINISKYNLKRKVIRLTPTKYNSKNLYTIAVSSLIAGYSLININKNKSLKTLSYCTPNIDYLNKSSILTILISSLTTNAFDAKIGLILLSIILIYQYLINDINITSIELTKKPLKKLISKDNYSQISTIQNKFLTLNKISFITTLILILREVLLIIN